MDRINFDIVGICETRRKGEGYLTLNKSSHQFYYKGGNTHQNGIGFIVNKNIAGNVTSFKGISDRVAQLTIKINNKYHVNIIQVYLPTSSHTNEEVDTVYEEIDNLVNNNKAYYNIVMGDFNAKTGQGNASELGTGPYGLGTRNARGDSLINFAVRHQLKIMNTMFKKSPNRRWTWISPNGHTKNEIDFILANRPHTFTDVSIINSLNTGSDHRLVRGSLTINTKLERARLIQRCKKPNTAVLSANTTKYQTLLTNRFEALATSTDLNSECENVTSAITETAMEIAGQNKPQKPDKLSAETKQLREKRRQMKRGGTDVQNIKYVETCKAIRRRMAEEIRSYNEERQLQALKNNKGLKSIKRKQLLGRNKIVSLKEEDGTLIRGFNRMIQRCGEFYTKLYSTRQVRQSSVPALSATYEPPPPILPSEVRVAIKRLKRGKAPGEDNITTAVLQDGGEPIIKALTQLSNRCLSDGRVPSSWKSASVVLIHKKGDTADIKNYRPISLLPVIYKVFSHILLQRMLQALEQHQPEEQAGFRPGFSTTDHIHVVSQLQEKPTNIKFHSASPLLTMRRHLTPSSSPHSSQH